MTEHIEHFVEIANEMIERYGTLRIMQDKLDRMSRLEWNRPPGMNAPWMRDFKTTAPYDAVRAGVRVLSGLDEDVTIDPYAFPEMTEGDLTSAKLKANAWEMALKWQMNRAARRRAILRQDVTRSALMYDEIVGQVIHLPTQIKAIKKMGGKTNRQEAALRYGDFAVLLRNPKSVYTRYSDYMLEAVLYTAVKRPEDIQAFWNSPDLGALIENGEASKKWVLFDYVDYDRRVVFCYPGETVQRINPGGVIELENGKEGVAPEAIELMNESWEYDFLPWACVIGGTQLDQAPENSRFPLLYGILQADQWNNTNIIGTLMMSEAIAEAARPDVARQGIQPDSIEATYGQPGGTWDVPAGHTVTPMPDKGLDPALREALDRQLGDMSRATIPQVLVNAESMPNEPFAGFNQRIQQAMASLMPYKFLSERWFEDAYRLMLYWAKESDKSIVGYGRSKDKELSPSIYEIMPKDIDKNSIYLKVELQADVPIDKQQRMMTAIQASRELKMPTRDVLEMLGDTNPEQTLKEWMTEQMDMAYFNGVLEKIQFDASQALEQQRAQAQLQAQVQQAQGMIEQQAAQAQQAQQAPQPGTPPGIPGAEGQGFNPAAGGIPPQMGAPGATMEGQTGMTRGGEPVVG